MTEEANRIAFLPIWVRDRISLWLNQCSDGSKLDKPFYMPDGFPDRFWLPEPNDLGALAEFASAIVMYDGIAITNGPVDHCSIIPESVFSGYVNAYDSIEEMLSETPLGFETAVEEFCPPEIMIIHKALNKDVNNPLPGSGSIGRHATHYLAWECFSNLRKPQTLKKREGEYGLMSVKKYSKAVPILDLNTLLARSALEIKRPNQKDLLERPFADAMMQIGELQLPLILGVAISNIDHPRQLVDELMSMRASVRKIKDRLNFLESIIIDPTRKGSGKDIRLIRNDLVLMIKKAAGDYLSASSKLDEVAGLASLSRKDWISSALNLLKLLNKPELRLLSRWTKGCAFNTVLKLRKLFKTTGSEAEWHAAAEGLMVHGTIAWYPLR